MDIRQIEYMLMIGETLNITKAAERLHLTQPALNQQLLKVERDLGCSLFVRKRGGLILTDEGEVYLNAARLIYQTKEEAYRSIKLMCSQRKIIIRLGISPGREGRVLASIHAAFHQARPNCVLQAIEMRGFSQIRELTAGHLDIGLVSRSDEVFSGLHFQLIRKEEILLAYPEKLWQEKPLEKVELSSLRDIPFVLMSSGTTFRHKTNALFEQAGFVPDILYETFENGTVLDIVQNGNCVGLVPDWYRRDIKGVAWAHLTGNPFWEWGALYREGAQQNPIIRDLINTMSLINPNIDSTNEE